MPVPVPSLKLSAIGLALLALMASARADGTSELYQARAFVTGQGEAERARGFALCLEDVLVKLSGDPRLRDDPRLAPLEAQAARIVAAFHYHDRMSGLAVHDEQGTRDRPFDLFVSFDPAGVDAALRSLERAPWLAARPRVVVLLGVRDAQTSYVLATDGERGLGQRQALAAAAEKRALPMVLPSTAVLAVDAVSRGQLGDTAARFDGVQAAVDGDATLIGRLVWTEAALGWTAAWRFAWQGREHRWEIAGVSFDDAFRDAVDHVLAIVSPNGAPR
jgi:hypothetical protein